jgi:hypothetical protein
LNIKTIVFEQVPAYTDNSTTLANVSSEVTSEMYCSKHFPEPSCVMDEHVSLQDLPDAPDVHLTVDAPLNTMCSSATVGFLVGFVVMMIVSVAPLLLESAVDVIVGQEVDFAVGLKTVGFGEVGR